MFSRTNRKVTASATVEQATTLKYPHKLNLYTNPPTDEIALEEFETWAIDRLRVLAEIEAASVREMTFEGIRGVVQTQCDKYLPMHSKGTTPEEMDAERMKDHISHFSLRLAFCQSEELRTKFVKAETMLFRVRYSNEDPKERQGFINSLPFGGDRVSDGDKIQLKTPLMAATPSLRSDADFEAEVFYRVPWTKVIDLVATRRVFLRAGYAFVPSTLQSSIINQEFSSRLTIALETTARHVPTLDEEDRLFPILEQFSSAFLAGVSGESAGGFNEAAGVGDVTKDMIDELSRRHFPVCMRHLHNSLRRDQHLKHWGRLQYVLFLKVVGLPIDEALSFWREAYGNKMTNDKFNKEYRYNIRHSYGLEGKRSNYPAKSCGNIITNNRPGPGDAHGCPFRDFNPDRLQTTLSDLYGIPARSTDIDAILAAAQAQSYHVACTRVFELTHGGIGLVDGESVSHPNQYTARSRELARVAEENARAAGKPEIEIEIEAVGNGEGMSIDS